MFEQLLFNENALLIIFGCWLLILSISFYWILSHYRRLIKGTDGSLKKVLENILKQQELNKREISHLNELIERLGKEGLSHIQKTGLVRFNPFNETGGDNSFSLALLDKLNNGLVITGLHTRERTRIYVKSIEGGKTKYDLSKEEKKAIDLAV